METQTNEKQKIMDSLLSFINQRSGIESGNYFNSWHDRDGVDAFKTDQRRIARDGKEARILLDIVADREWITGDDLKEAFSRAWSGRLSWDGNGLDYCTGQYFPVEYRKAACAVLAFAIISAYRREGNDLEYIRRNFKRSGAARWFN